ncbi:hypothetical protein Megvenef_00594 [Candidatus Megaera venefica]|uniref:Tetratricopeptide repeat protein n=1 Tax=Candidatus Megaera venefica TaxID=2055910 RepID=A0ABU5NBX2_9RICK|nr:hypothetical protein [Candidatus Megaera venefica]MEA0970627.1 hypothetical protein [Candidatus Megaera venefica]
MINIKKTLLFLTCLLFVQAAKAVLPIRIETKAFGKDVIFVFYHDKDQIVDLKATGNNVTASINIPSEFNLVNPGKFNEFASGIKSTSNNQKINFTVKEDLVYQSVINGEKLDAIKFKTNKVKEEDLSTIGAANNDPGAIKYSNSSGEHVLSFNLGNEDSKVAAFFRGKYIWIVFDQKKVFSFKEGGVFSKFELIPSDKGTVMRMAVDPSLHQAKIDQIESGWNIRVGSKEDKNWRAQNILTPEPLTGQDGFLLKGNFAKNEIITFEDPELGDVIKTLPVITGGSRVSVQRDSIEYSLLRSIQGIAVVLLSDEVTVEKNQDSLKVISNTALSEDHVIDANLFPSPIDEFIKMPSILPYLDKNLNILDFNQQKSRLISEAAQSKDNSEAFVRNLALARFYFIHEWYQESLDSLKIAKQYSSNDYEANLQARFLMAVNYTMIGEHSSAKDEYDSLLTYHDIQRVSEINMWSKFNEFALGSNPSSIGLLELMPKTINLYSDDKYWSMVFAEIELALLSNDLKLLERIFKEVRSPAEGSQYFNSLKYYKASYYRKKNQHNLAKQYYRELMAQDLDMFNKVRAEFDLVKLQVEEEEITPSQAAESLEKLRFSWRGDQLEYQILLQLASYYRDSRDMLNSLRTFQYAQTAFSNKVSNFYITSEMARIFNEVFLPGGLGEEMDDFTIVALFYEFKELNPIGEQGDDVIISIAKRLVKLDLLDNASELLRHQITYRLQGEKRVTNADNLAVILMMDKKPSEAILVLDETDKDNVNFNEHQYRVRLRAQALITLEKYDDALLYLKDDNSEDGEIIRREALFQAKYWNKYADQIMPDFDDLVSRVGDNMDVAQDILRLAISYYMMNVHDQLVVISNAIGDKNAILKNTVDLLIASSGSVDYRNLDQSLDINQMKTLLDKYKNQFLSK